jgi:AcrR family transcriptional regulator
MQVLKEEIRERIKNAAIDVFFDKGFLKATMKEIALKADVPTGLLYSYYENKESLLEKIVVPIHSQVKKLIKKNHPEDEGTIDFFFSNELPKIFERIFTHRKEIVIIVDKCSGTKYENLKNVVIDDIAEHIKKQFVKRLHNSEILLDDLFFHIVAHNFSEGFFEIARHYKNEDWARRMLYLLARQQMYGLSGI